MKFAAFRIFPKGVNGQTERRAGKGQEEASLLGLSRISSHGKAIRQVARCGWNFKYVEQRQVRSEPNCRYAVIELISISTLTIDNC